MDHRIGENLAILKRPIRNHSFLVFNHTTGEWRKIKKNKKNQLCDILPCQNKSKSATAILSRRQQQSHHKSAAFQILEWLIIRICSGIHSWRHGDRQTDTSKSSSEVEPPSRINGRPRSGERRAPFRSPLPLPAGDVTFNAIHAVVTSRGAVRAHPDSSESMTFFVDVVAAHNHLCPQSPFRREGKKRMYIKEEKRRVSGLRLRP